MEQLLVFQSYPDGASAQQVADLLEENGIPVELMEDATLLDSNFMGQNFTNPFRVKIPGSRFDEANKLLDEHTAVNLDEVDKDYVLLTFSDAELIDVLKHKADWGIYNYKLAGALLRKRGVPIPEESIESFQKKDILEKEKPAEAGTVLLCMGYFSAIFGSGIALYQGGSNWFKVGLPGILAIVIGWNLAYFKRTLSSGKQAYYFSHSARKQGLVLIWLAMGMFLLKVIQAIALM